MFKLVSGKCPNCGHSIRYTERLEGSSAWLPCCEINVVWEDGKMKSTGVKAYDWVRRQGGEMHVG